MGDFDSYDSLLSIGYPTVDIIDGAANNKIIAKDVPNSVPDQVLIQGKVLPSNAVVSLQWRGGQSFPGTPQADWQIFGDKGSLRVTSSLWALNVGHPDTKLELFDARKGTVETVAAEKAGWDELPSRAHNIARLYEAYRKKEWYPDFEWAVKRHEIIEELWERFDQAR